MKLRKLLVLTNLLLIADLLVGCATALKKEDRFTNEIKNEFKRIECADKDSKYRTKNLNCYLDFARSENLKSTFAKNSITRNNENLNF